MLSRAGGGWRANFPIVIIGLCGRAVSRQLSPASDTNLMMERRRYARLSLERPVKVRCLTTGRYFAGNTQNLSSGGALIHVEHPSVMISGQRIRVGIAQNPRQVLLTDQDFSDATVIRALGMGDSQQLAVQFDHLQQLAAAG